MTEEQESGPVGAYSLGSRPSQGEVPSQTGTEDADDVDALMPADKAQYFESRWEEIQAAFVDDPRRSLEQANQLVDVVVRQLTQGFSTERTKLEDQWARGADVSTEELRVALQRYRSFFHRLLATGMPTSP